MQKDKLFVTNELHRLNCKRILDPLINIILATIVEISILEKIHLFAMI